MEVKNQWVVHWEDVNQGTTLGSASIIALGGGRGLGDCDPLNSHSPVSLLCWPGVSEPVSPAATNLVTHPKEPRRY